MKQGIVMTAQIAEQMLVFTRDMDMDDDRKLHCGRQFAKHVGESLARFMRHDWGTVCDEDWQANDADAKGFEMGRYGRIIANYTMLPYHPKDPNRIWIVRDEQAITVMFPEEY